MQKAYLTLGSIVALLLFSVGCSSNNRDGDMEISSEEAVSDFEFPAAIGFDLATISGDNISLEQYQGKVVLINFWATWCGPCREEMPMLMKLQDELGDSGLQVIGISVDEEGEGVVADFVEDYNFNYPIAVDEVGALSAGYGAQFAVPTTIVIDRKGKIRHRIIGLIDEATLRPLVDNLLSPS